MSKTLRWGIIGLGWFGEIHAETLSTMPGHRAGRALHAPARSGWLNWPIGLASPGATRIIAICWPIPRSTWSAS